LRTTAPDGLQLANRRTCVLVCTPYGHHHPCTHAPDDPIPLVDYHGANALCVPYGEPGHRPSAPFCPDDVRLLAHLHRDLDALTVDEIDGEFY